MANALYPLARQGFASAQFNWLTDDIRTAFVTSGYVYSDTDEFYTDLGANVLADSANMAAKTNVGGVLDAADLTVAVPAGTVTGLVVYKWTGVAATSRLICYYGSKATAELISLTTDGSNVIVRWSNGPTKMLRI